MRLHAEFARRAAVHAAPDAWVASPMPGVERLMLDRIGGEVARATSLVRYAPGSAFAGHTHACGEEYLVLEGVFQDESGDHPVGTYVRNPPGSAHVPASAPGCTIFVKLWQFDPEDLAPLRIETGALPRVDDPLRPGVRLAPLLTRRDEAVRIEEWAPGTRAPLPAPRGLELLVLAGSLTEGGATFGLHDWLRLPPGHSGIAEAGPAGATLWVKAGHLAAIRLPPGA
ncbi:cupin domain-containing protein [Sediminicoccus rosea]|uniref:Cupin domain-containing protein n=1 Tax=Sediminicoccus rosea TaxID=1225128 RepID=A0ABZ0PDW3_9PROT|nr:cupin domain-containing protein [Sediminicoccus rosea]WPB83662.1 cupin domain-containing protein [Sediminicoccus rosea]